MKYHDFDFWIDKRTEKGYPLRACCEEQGEARDVSLLRPDSEKMREIQSRLARRDTDRAFLVETGAHLFAELFSGQNREVETLFEQCCGRFLGNGEGIRILLRIEAPEVAVLPWELLYSRSRDRFLATSVETPLVRYVELRRPIRKLITEFPVRMLVAVPEGSNLNTETEVANLSAAVKGLRKYVETTVLKKRVSLEAIRDTLVDSEFHVFHFIGHGEFQNDQPLLVLNDGNGGLESVDAAEFAGLFENHLTMKLVLLNSCKGAEVSSTQPLVGMASQLVKEGVPAVIAMQYEIGNNQAILFARQFYRSLFRGANKGRLEIAVSHARKSLLQDFPGDRVVGTPVLFTRAPEGVLFALERHPLKAALQASQSADAFEAVKRAQEKIVQILEERAASGEDVAESLSEEKAAQEGIQERFRLRKVAVVTAFLAPVLFALLWLGFLDRLPPGFKPESYVVWLVQKLPKETFSDRIAMVFVSPSLDTQSRGREPGENRRDHARLVEALSQAGAKVVVFDLYFPKSTRFDDEFSRAIHDAKGRGTAVVVGVEELRDGKPALASALADTVSGWGLLCLGEVQDSTEVMPLLIDDGKRSPRGPLPSLSLASVAAFNGWTIVGLEGDSGAVVIKDAEGSVKSIGVSTLERLSHGQRSCGVLSPGDLVAGRIIDFTPARDLRDPRRRLAYEAILKPSDPQSLRGLNGKLVVVGVERPSESFDIRPGLGREQRYGFELHADAMNTLLRGITIRRPSDGRRFLIILGLSLCGGLLWHWQPKRQFLRRGLLLGVALLYLSAVICIYLRYRVRLDTAYPLVGLLVSYMILGRRRR